MCVREGEREKERGDKKVKRLIVVYVGGRGEERRGERRGGEE